jgi:hypothetical protein
LVNEAALASDDPYDLVQADIDFVNWAIQQALLTRAEIPREAYLAYHVDYYLAQVNNGGHGQFASNSGMRSNIISDISLGLEIIEAGGFLKIFTQFLEIVKSNSEVASLIQSDTESSSSPDQLEKTSERFKALSKWFGNLDNRFFDLNKTDPLVSRNAGWLRTLPVLKVLPTNLLGTEMAAIIAKNRLFSSRQAKRAADQEAYEARQPMYIAAKALCAAAGLRFLGFTTGRVGDNPGYFSWGVRTSEGVRLMDLGSKDATLWDKEKKKPLANVRVVVP